MKLTQKFEDLLHEIFTEVIVIDQKGDGHHVEMIIIDEVFAGKTRIEKSRYAFEKLGGFTKQVHALTVKCFTPEQWALKKDSFTQTQYVHIR